MANLIFNTSLGKCVSLAALPAANDALIVVLLSGTVQADSTLRSYTDLASLLAANTEQTTMGRKTLTGVTVTAGNPTVVTADSPTWVGASGAAVVALLLCYDPDTTSGTDSSIVPIAKYDWSVTPTGSDVTAPFASSGAGGLFSATS